MKRIVLAIAFLTTPISGLSDTGSSHNLFYLNKINSPYRFIARANLATRDGLDLFFGYIDADLRIKIDRHWSFEAGYRQASLELGDQWRNEYRPMLNLAYRGKINDWKFSNRHRIEFRYFEGNAKDRIRYRNESVWTSPQKISRYNTLCFRGSFL